MRGFDAAYCFGSYEGVLRELIHLFKYAGMRPLARPLGDMLARGLPLELSFDLIVPVPLHWSRRWRRGFNQSMLLAGEIGRRRRIPVKSVLARGRATRVQAGLSNTRRRANVRGAFHLRWRCSARGLRILLIDDVMTTGATAASCASALKAAGAKSVTLLTLARVDRRFAGGRPLTLTARTGDIH